MSDPARPDATRLRPTFTLRLDLPREEAIERLRARLEASRSRDCWRGKGRWCEIHLPDPEQRIWTPHLSLRLDHEHEGSSIFGRFAPRPGVWTFFMFLYALVVFLILFGATLGYVQWASNERAWGLWAVWAGIPVLGLIHLAAYVGQRLGRAQMEELKSRLDEVLEGLPLQERGDG
ncbi:MAG: hypothetical protein RQ751_06010 [Longimicrobiales bacterium]|nr:hypothetical protein [Longimicrobiales bacterium]